jgi:hypothetical protein
MITEINEMGINPELLWGTNDVFKIAQKILHNEKPLNVQEGALHKKVFENF